MPSDRVPLLGSIAGCNRWGVVFSQTGRGAIAGCHGKVLLDAMVRCHCRVPW